MLKQSLVSILRDKNTNIAQFRRAAEKLGYALAVEASQQLEVKKKPIETPIQAATGVEFKNDIVLVAILRSALALLFPFLKFFEHAKVGFVGMKRDEKTAVANLYYKNIPKISKKDDVILLDPMIATGGSGCDSIKLLKQEGVAEDRIIFVAIICAKQGLLRIKKTYPKVRIIYAQRDEKLNKNFFIIPGLGDFGDRFFGTL